MSWSLKGSYFETCSCDLICAPVASSLTIAEATRSKIDAFGITYEAKTGVSTSEFAWTA